MAMRPKNSDLQGSLHCLMQGTGAFKPVGFGLDGQTSQAEVAAEKRPCSVILSEAKNPSSI